MGVCMKKIFHSKPAVISASVVILAFMIILLGKSRTDYTAAVMCSTKNYDKFIVFLNMNKKAVVKRGTGFKLCDNALNPIVSTDGKYLAYSTYNDMNNKSAFYIKNLGNKKEKEVLSPDKCSDIRSIKWINTNTLIYINGNTLFTLDINSLKPKAVKMSKTPLKMDAVYDSKSSSFIVLTDTRDMRYTNPATNDIESALYSVDAKGNKEKLLKTFTEFYTMSICVIPGTDNILLEAISKPGENLWPDMYIYNIKSGSLKLITRHSNDIALYENILPYDNNNFLFQSLNRLYNVNIQTGKINELKLKSQHADEYFCSITSF